MTVSDLVELGEGPDWDEVVDIVCVGTGAVALAVGVAAERVGLDALVTDPGGTRGSVLTGDAGAYLAELLDDIVPAEHPGPEPVIRRPGDGHQPEPAAGVLFSGPALRDWGGMCLASPLGMLSTEVAGAGAVAIPVATAPDGAPVDIDEWVRELARDCGLAARAGTVLRDLVFIGGRVAGVVLGTPGGEIVVRAVVGVVIAIGDEPWPGLHTPTGTDAVELVIRPRPFSRFARLELQTPD